MSPTPKKGDPKQLESLIKTAMKKLGLSTENSLCRYIPSGTEGYIHHFTMRKMKTEDPVHLAELITKHIINKDNPHKVSPKKRAPRGSRKRRDQLPFTKHDIEKILSMARLANEHDLVRKLAPSKDFRAVKKELLASIRREEVDQALWHSYAEMAQMLKPSQVH